ncbi:mycothiol synthase [Arthrobacter sp. H14]|uniref:mycothiol synthase n=1 Tax=Arthrobacter sp. H14 TaxID=1312959 RepID=UPI00047890BD|nr:mycothiol synthase [Arthrobacter sp. H14]
MSQTTSGTWPVHTIKGRPNKDLLRDISTLADAANESDGNPPLSEQTLVNLRSEDCDETTMLSFATYIPEEEYSDSDDGSLAGVAVVSLDPEAQTSPHGVLELVVHPNYRNQGIGTSLVGALKETTKLTGLRAWSHGNHEAAVELAGRYGFTSVRELWRMRLTRALQSAAQLHYELPEGVRLRPFEPAQDEEAWLKVNAAAFAHHPEQGATTLNDLKARMEEDWFDPNGFLLAERDGELLGFHWTKVHPRSGSHPAIGEVYVVGVSPDAQGLGLGKALTIAGIEYLHEAGLNAIMLYVDADNEAAVALYQKLGFTRWDVDVMYAPKTDGAGL